LKKASAIIRAVFIADHPETFVTRRIPKANLEFVGIPGDRHFGITRKAGSRQPMYPKGTVHSWLCTLVEFNLTDQRAAATDW
jgi:hypothetical protein